MPTTRRSGASQPCCSITWLNGAGGQLQFSAQEVPQIHKDLSSKMIRIQLGDTVKLRIIDRVPELQQSAFSKLPREVKRLLHADLAGDMFKWTGGGAVFLEGDA